MNSISTETFCYMDTRFNYFSWNILLHGHKV